MADGERPVRPEQAQGNPITDADIVTRRDTRRRRFFWSVGAGLMGFGVAAFAGQSSSQKKHDFPKGTSDNDVSKLADIKHQHVDRDDNDGFSDDDVSRLRDAKRSRDSD
jgi:hypothetical protein